MKEKLIKPEVQEIKEIIKQLSEFDLSLNDLIKVYNENKSKISILVKDLINFELESILSNISVEELNKVNPSIRTSLLMKNGITNFLKIYKMKGINSLSRISGVSETAAYDIRNSVYADAKKIRESLYPKLNIENKNKFSNELVKVLYIHIQTDNLIEQVRALYNNHHKNILENIQDSQILLSKVKWLFATANHKNIALQAYKNLQNIIRDNYVVDADFLINNSKKIFNVVTKIAWEDYKQNSARYYTILDNYHNIKFEDIAKNNGLKGDFIESVNALVPDLTGLNCTLRSYQEFGTKYILHQGYVLLGDEMGLGKTVQAIASMVALRNFGEGKFLVVCPASVLINWCREIQKFSDLAVYKLHGDDRDECLEKWNINGGVAVTTYQTLDKLDFKNVFKISMLVADEAHYVKNPKAIRTKNLVDACDRADRVLFMTGTALENRVDEMCYLISCLDYQLSTKISSLKHLSSAPIFREEISTVYLRRTRQDVLQELPELIEKDEWCEMTLEDVAQYVETVNEENFMAMRQVSWNVKNVLNSSKAQRLVSIQKDAEQEERKVIVFSYFLNTLNQVQKLFKKKCYGPITGSVDPKDRQLIIDEFAKAEDGSVLLAQIQAGGTGVNIQSASCVVLCEPQLKPSTENQAISRAYRMGQVRNVEVFKLLCEESVDEQIVEILKAKDIIFEHFADISEAGQKGIEITKKMSENIIQQEKERLQQLKEKE